MRRVMNQALISFRQQLGLNQREFAKVVGVDPATLAKYENDRYHPKYDQYLRMKQHAKLNGGIDLPDSLFTTETVASREPSAFAINSLKELRIHWGFNQSEMAEFLGISFRTYGRYERGDSIPSATTWIKIKELARRRGVQLIEALVLSEAEASRDQ